MYFDYNATTPVRDEVVRAMSDASRRLYGNPSSSYSEGRRARVALEDAREDVARAIGATGDEITFTSGASEANNTVLRSLAAGRAFGARRTLLTTEIEHASVVRAARAIEGIDVRVIPVDRFGHVTFEAFLESMGPEVGVVAIIFANNEVGTIQSADVMRKIGEHCTQRGVLFHLDVTQAVGKVPVDVKRLGCHSAAISAHKFYGPRGIGALYADAEHSPMLVPLIGGGKQERDFRAGTENVPAAIGMGLAATLAVKEMPSASARAKAQRDYIEGAITGRIPGCVVHGSPRSRLPNTLSISLPHVDSRAFLAALDRRGVSVNVGSACSKGKRSLALEAMGVPESQERGVFRVSVGKWTTMRECRRLVDLMVGTWWRAAQSPARHNVEGV